MGATFHPDHDDHSDSDDGKDVLPPETSEEDMEDNRRIGRRIGAIINTANTSLLRSTYIAGYGYYQIANSKYKDLPYDVFCVLTFSLSLLSVHIGSLLVYYLQVSRKHKWHYLSFKSTLDSFNGLARIQFQLFLFSSIFFMLSLSREGYNSFPDYSDKYIPFIIMLFGLVFVLYCIFAVVGRQLEFQDLGNDEKKSTKSSLVRKSIEIESLVSELQEEYLEQQQLDFAGRNKKFCDNISSRAVYIINMTQYTLKKYHPSGSIAGTFFIILSTFSLFTGLVTLFISSVSGIFIEDTIKKSRMAYVLRIYDILNISSGSYVLSFLLLDIAIILTPYGNDYSDFGSLNTIFGLFAIILSVCAILSCRKSYFEVRYLPDTQSIETEDDIVAKKKYVDDVMKQSSLVGGQATVSSGFVFSLMLTFYKDVYKYNKSLKAYTYLALALITITSGLTAAILDTLIGLYTNSLQNSNKIYHFIIRTRWITITTNLLFFISLYAWFALFAMFGFTRDKQDKNLLNYRPLVCSLLGIGMIIMANVYLDGKYEFVDVADYVFKILKSPLPPTPNSAAIDDEPRDRHSISGEDSHHDGHHDGHNDYDHKKAKSQYETLNLVGYKLLFLGGTAFLYTSAFSFDSDSLGYFYNIMCSITFTISAVLVSWALLYNIRSNQIMNKIKEFSIETVSFYKISIILGSLLLITFLMAISCVGSANRPLKNQDGINAIIICTVIFIFTLLFASLAQLTYFHSTTLSNNTESKTRMESGPPPPKTSSEQMRGKEIDRYEEQINNISNTSAFVASNVAGELITSVAKSTSAFFNYYYFIMTGITFGTSIVALSMSTQIKYYLWESVSLKERLMYGAMLANVKSTMFFLYLVSLLSWNLSLLFLVQVKIDGVTKSGSEEALFYFMVTFNTLAILGTAQYTRSLSRVALGRVGGDGGETIIGGIGTAYSARSDDDSTTASQMMENPLLASLANVKIKKSSVHRKVVEEVREL